VFGTFRFVLALAVAASHLALQDFIGHYAVFGFYLLSGYLMTLVTNRTYGFGYQGFTHYAVNRVLRIYPGYFVALVLSVIAILLVAEPNTTRFNIALRLPDEALGVLSNLTLVGLSHITPARLVPPAWALAVEFAFYILIGLGFGRSIRAAAIWFALSCIATVLLLVAGAPFGERYFPIYAASLPFSLGALIFQLKESGKLRLNRSLAAVLATLIPILTVWNLFSASNGRYQQTANFYLSLLLLATTVFLLSDIRLRNRFLLDLDTLLGGLSYPIYLLHWQCGAIVGTAFGFDPNSAQLFLATLPLLLALSWTVRRYVEIPIERTRSRFRNGRVSPARTAPTPQPAAH
jgi:peptidoglycan/LPS O-acetylase OafA/YrhL